MDWNWFYSTAAQSVAAIVGIFAAFVITKIINNQSLFARNRLEIKAFINISERLREQASRTNFDSYNRHVSAQQFSILMDRLKLQSSYRSPEEYVSQLHFSEYDSKEDIIDVIKIMIESFKNHSELSLQNYADIPADVLDREKREIDSLVSDVRQNVRSISSFLDNIAGNPESSRLITFAIICTLVLFFVGVIYPLSFLPSDNGNAVEFALSVFLDRLCSLKGIILALVSIIFSSIMVVFFLVNVRLRHSSDELQKLRSFTRLSAYSSHLGLLETGR